MTYFELEFVKSFLFCVLAGYLWRLSHKEHVSGQPLWNYFFVGFVLILAGFFVGMTKDFPYFNRFIVLGNTYYATILKNGILHPLGFISLVMGIGKLMPFVDRLRSVETELKVTVNSLEDIVQQRTADLKAINEQLTTEIEERRRTEDDLRQSEQRLSLALEGANLGIWDWDLTTGKGVWTQRTHEILGYKPEEVIPNVKSWKQIVHPHDWQGVSARLNSHLEGKEPLFDIEHRMLNKSGDWQWVHGLGKTMEYSTEGKPTRMTGIMMDISRRKKTEQALLESEERYRQLVENLNEGIFVVKEGTLVFANSRSIEFTGFSGEELTSKYFLDFVHPDDRERIMHQYAKRMKGDKEPHQYPVRIITRDGRTLWLLVQTRLIPWHGGEAILVSATDITLLKTTENALRESEELLSGVLDALPDVVGVQLPDYTVIRYNRAGYELLELEQEEVAGRKCYELIGRSERCAACATFRALRSKKTESLEKYVPELGRHLWCTSSPLSDSNGEVRLVIERLVDITDRKRTEEALAESEAKYRFLAEHANDVIWTVDLNMRTTYVSPSIERLLGFTPEERQLQNIEDQLTAESLEFVRQNLLEELVIEREQGIRPDQSVSLELDYRHKNGSIVCLESVMKFIRDDTGAPIGVHGLSRDVTERKRAEEALRRSEEFNRRVVDHAPFGIVYLAGDGTIEYVNPAANRIAGIPEGQVSPLLGRNILQVPSLKNRQTDREDLRRLLEGEFISNAEMTYTSSVGLETFLLFSATPRFGSDGEVIGATLMFTDISDRKRSEELQRETVRFRAVADLAGGVAHNFNNLLQVVIGKLELALIDLESSNYRDVKDGLETVLESSKYGAETVRRLQSFAGIRDHTRLSEKGVFDLSGIVRQALEMTKTWWKTIPEKQGIEVSLDRELQDGCLVQGEKNELFEVAVNLIKNATEALPQGGTINVANYVENNQVVLKIQDTGIGISEDNLKRLFNPFFTTKAQAGSGLGLASGRKVIEDCGGQIVVESSEGQGTTFTILLPLAEKSFEQTKPAGDISAPRMTVLVIDDMDAVLEVLKAGLTHFGHAVVTASSGEQGLAFSKRIRLTW